MSRRHHGQSVSFRGQGHKHAAAPDRAAPHLAPLPQSRSEPLRRLVLRRGQAHEAAGIYWCSMCDPEKLQTFRIRSCRRSGRHRGLCRPSRQRARRCACELSPQAALERRNRHPHRHGLEFAVMAGLVPGASSLRSSPAKHCIHRCGRPPQSCARVSSLRRRVVPR